MYILIIVCIIMMNRCYGYLYRCISSNRIVMSSNGDSINKSRIIKRIMNDNKKIDTKDVLVTSIDRSITENKKVVPSDRIYKRQPKEEIKETDKELDKDPKSWANRKKMLAEKRRAQFLNSDTEKTPDRPFTLPPGEFRPKQSLGQNFLSDQNYVLKIVNELKDTSEDGHKVIEIGPGPGALTRVLYERYPKMTAIEIDQRAVEFLATKLPGLKVINKDVLEVDWPQIASERNGKVNIIANLPYYIVSQVLFSLADSHKAIEKAIVTMQLEVAERICASPNTKAYGIPSVVFQLYANPKMNFKIPPTVFYPAPKVDSALITLDFTKPHPELHSVDGDQLRRVITEAFRKRRKMMRQSLKELLNQEGLEIPEKWAERRPEQLTPSDFLELTRDLFQSKNNVNDNDNDNDKDELGYKSKKIWRALYSINQKEPDTNQNDISDSEE